MLYQKSFQILKQQFQVHPRFRDKRTSARERTGWPADKQAETNNNFMQHGSEPPFIEMERLREIGHGAPASAHLELQPAPPALPSLPAEHRFVPSPCSQEASGASRCSEQPLPFTPCRLLLDIFQIPQPGRYCLVNFRGPAYSFNHKAEHSQALRYHLSNLVSTNSAFQKQETQKISQSVARRAEKMITAGFPIKTLNVPNAF